jgi:hypothetical protein
LAVASLNITVRVKHLPSSTFHLIIIAIETIEIE